MQVKLSITLGIINFYSIPQKEESYILDSITAILQSACSCREKILFMLNAFQKDFDSFCNGKLILNTCLNYDTDIHIAQVGLSSKWDLSLFIPHEKNSDEFIEKKNILYETLSHLKEQTSNIYLASVDSLNVYDNTVHEDNSRNLAYDKTFLHMIEKSDLLILPWNVESQSYDKTLRFMQSIAGLKKPIILIPYGLDRDKSINDFRLHQNNIRYYFNNDITLVFKYSKEFNKVIESFLFENLFYGQNIPFSEYRDDRKKLLECVYDTNAKESILSRFFSNSWNFMLNAFAPVKKTPSAPPDAPQEILETLSIFDNIAGRYARFYRSYFLWMPILGALAVTFATCGIALPSSLLTILGLGISELLILFIILFLYNSAHNGRWQEKLADYRLIAEIFRVNAYLYPIGFSFKMHDTLPNYAICGIVWKEFLVKMLMHNCPNKSRQCSIEEGKKVLENFIDDQISYHVRNVKQLEKLEHRLHFLMTAMFFISLLCGIAHVTMEIVHVLHIHILAKILALFTVLLPLYSMVIHAISQYADIHRLSIRSKTIILKLNSIKELNKKDKHIETTAYSIAETMISDVTEWNVQSQMNHVALG